MAGKMTRLALPTVVISDMSLQWSSGVLIYCCDACQSDSDQSEPQPACVSPISTQEFRHNNIAFTKVMFTAVRFQLIDFNIVHSMQQNIRKSILALQFIHKNSCDEEFSE